MPQSYSTILLGSLGFLNAVHALPRDSRANVARADKYIIGQMGDSWGSGVTYPHVPFNDYDGNADGCLRYKYAWATVVKADYAKWAPSNAPKEAELEFKACSGSHIGQNMKDQMDKMSRPKLVMMEAGGNDADFYPLADACLFHAEGKDYGKKYEDDKGPVGKREGLCKYEIDQVRDRLTGDRMAKFQAAIRQTIHDWRGHKSVKGNDATLMTVGYARFFAEGKECDDMKFTIPGASEQKVVLDMRKDINELIGYMNDAIRTATESFSDKKIQYTNIDVAFQGHRFCEPGSTSWDNANNNDAVWIWNQPTKWWISITKGGETKQYERGPGTLIETSPPKDLFNSLIGHQDGQVTKDGEYTVVNYKDPKDANNKMTIKTKAKDAPGVLNGSKSRTLHPTQSGHKAMGDAIVQRLKQVMQGSTGPIVLPSPPQQPGCPSGCTCSSPGAVPLCF